LQSSGTENRLHELIRAFIALVATVSALIAPLLMLTSAILGFSDFSQTMELIKTWLAYVGPFAGVVIGYYFHRSERPRP